MAARRLAGTRVSAAGACVSAGWPGPSPPGERADRLHGVDLRDRLVVAVAQDAGEAQRHATRVAGRLLHAVERDLDHLLGPERHDPVAAVDGELLEALRLPREHLVGHPLEGLAEHDELTAVGVARAEVDIGEPPLAPPAAPLDGQDDEVE